MSMGMFVGKDKGHSFLREFERLLLPHIQGVIGALGKLVMIIGVEEDEIVAVASIEHLGESEVEQLLVAVVGDDPELAYVTVVGLVDADDLDVVELLVKHCTQGLKRRHPVSLERNIVIAGNEDEGVAEVVCTPRR